MRVILSNYRYFLSGGPERYYFAIKALLEKMDHEVIPFSVQSINNLPSKFSNFFLSPLDSENSTYFNQYRLDFFTACKVLERQFYSPEGFIKARKLSRAVDADLVYSIQHLNKMSPSVLDGFKSTKLPVVLRISDFGLVCPQAHFFDKTSVCEKCIKGNFLHAIKNRCVMNSFIGSFVKSTALSFHKIAGCYNRVDSFIFPSSFTRDKFIQAGFDESKLHHIPTFIDSALISPCYDGGQHILYFGRLVVEKGVHNLLKAYRDLPDGKPRLIAIGALGNTPYADALMNEYKDEVEFHAFMEKGDLKNYIQKALCVVIPSICYDNMPNVLLEAYAYGKPVIAPRHGSFLDLVRDGETGLFYEAGNTNDLREKLAWALAHPHEMANMGRAARALVESEFSPELHYKRLMSVFEKVIKANIK